MFCLSGRVRTYNNPDSKSGNHTNGSHLEIKKTFRLWKVLDELYIFKYTTRQFLPKLISVLEDVEYVVLQFSYCKHIKYFRYTNNKTRELFFIPFANVCYRLFFTFELIKLS